MEKLAFVIGNGPSRKEIDLSQLEQHGITLGCNALYREYFPKYLIAMDDKIITEIEHSNYPSHRFIVPPEKERYEFTTGRRANSGMLAMEHAIINGYKKLYCIGFDSFFMGLDNVFSGTENYDNPATQDDAINRAIYMGHFARKYSGIEFNLVIPDDVREIYPISSPNVKGIFMSQFKEVFSL